MPLRTIAASVTAALSLVLAGTAPAGAIVGGQDAAADIAPFQVGIDEQNKFVCGGFLRDATTVVTAAHCVIGAPTDTLTVRFDGLDRTRLAQSRGVSAVVTHPRFNWARQVNDVALLKLDAPVTETGTVKYAKLAASDPAPGAELTVTGWGVTRADTATPAIALQALREKVAPAPGCRAAAGGGLLGLSLGSLLGTGTNGALCGAPAPATGFCSGDSGGPAMVDGAVVGIVSRTRDCGKSGGYDIYSSVAQFHSWLTQPL